MQRATYASMKGLGSVHARVPWVGWVVRLREWRANVGGMLLFLLLLLLRFHPEKQILSNFYF